jgi:hypothetical protein
MTLNTSDLNTLTPEELVNILIQGTTVGNELQGEGVTVIADSISVTGDLSGLGSFSGGISEGLSIESGVLLASGDIANGNGPNEEDGVTTSFGTEGDDDLDSLLPSDQTTNDAAILEFDFIPDNEQFSFDYVFASDEYNEFANSAFNDVFGFFLNRVDPLEDKKNIALIPGTSTPVAINNINASDNNAFFRNNDPSDLGEPTPFNSEYDGFTTTFAASELLIPGETYHLKLAVADTSDSILDSAVFLKQGSLSTLGPSPNATITRNPQDVFTIEGTEGVATLKFTITGISSKTINEVGIFPVDDDEGTISGVSPEDSDYVKLALTSARSRAVFTGLFDDLEASRSRLIRDFNVGQKFGMYLVANGTTDTVLFDPNSTDTITEPDDDTTTDDNDRPELPASPISPFIPGADVFFAFPDASSDGVDHLQVSNNGGVLTLGWEDSPGGGDSDFNDLVLTVQAVQETQPQGIRQQGQIQREIIDLSSLSSGVSLLVGLTVKSEAAFTNTAGLYRVNDAEGTVTDPLTGDELTPNDAGYAEAAIRQRELTVDEEGNLSGDNTLNGFLAPFIIADGTPEEWLSENPDNQIFGQEIFAYFPYIEANPDGVDHIVLMGDNTFGIEDLPGLNSDFDYNDMILQINF